MANKLPGNPYAHYAEVHMDPALATLALAYEIRTRSMIEDPYSVPEEWKPRMKETTP